jgi:preprotein translocase subunit SecA
MSFLYSRHSNLRFIRVLCFPLHVQQHLVWIRRYRVRKILNEYFKVVRLINTLERSIQEFSDNNLRYKTVQFMSRLSRGESLEQLIPESFAVVREAARRTLGLRHYDIQLVGGMVLHFGIVAEMMTGEGKTIMATLPTYLNAITGFFFNLWKL